MTMATTAAGNKKEKSPKIKLAIDLPLVWGAATGGGLGADVDDETIAGAIAVPQTLQKLLPSGTLLPHPGQNITYPPSTKDNSRTFAKLFDTLLLRDRPVNQFFHILRAIFSSANHQRYRFSLR
ncbi:MAG: hypothetical protein WB421_11765 [Terriglobales bacterium]